MVKLMLFIVLVNQGYRIVELVIVCHLEKERGLKTLALWVSLVCCVIKQYIIM